jgi:hypothetical protein
MNSGTGENLVSFHLSSQFQKFKRATVGNLQSILGVDAQIIKFTKNHVSIPRSMKFSGVIESDGSSRLKTVINGTPQFFVEQWVAHQRIHWTTYMTSMIFSFRREGIGLYIAVDGTQGCVRLRRRGGWFQAVNAVVAPNQQCERRLSSGRSQDCGHHFDDRAVCLLSPQVKRQHK